MRIYTIHTYFIVGIGLALMLLSCGHKQPAASAEIDGIDSISVDDYFPESEPPSSEPLVENIIEGSFSHPTLKDTFIISIWGESILEGKMIFQIIDANGQEIWNDTQDATSLIGYGLEQPATDREKEKYIEQRVHTFFDADNFLVPAIKRSESFDMDYSDEEIWKNIRSDPTAIGFYYLLEEGNGCQIAFSKQQKKVFRYFCCC